MYVRITVETTFDNGEKRIHQLDGVSRPYRVTCPDGIGLRLEDGKRIVEQIQSVVLHDQVDENTRESRVCPDCAAVRAIHDYRRRVLDTLFGRVRVKAARLASPKYGWSGFDRSFRSPVVSLESMTGRC